MLRSKSTRLVVFVAALVSIVLVGTNLAQIRDRPEASTVPQWEYHTSIINNLRGGELNDLGKEGWDLVDFEHQKQTSTSSHFVCVFKRPVQ